MQEDINAFETDFTFNTKGFCFPFQKRSEDNEVKVFIILSAI